MSDDEMRELDRYVQRAARIADGDLWRRSPALALSQALGDIISTDDREAWAQQLSARPYDQSLPDDPGGVAILPMHDDERETIASYLRAVVTAHADEADTIDDRFFGEDDGPNEERRALFRSARVYHVDGSEYARAHRAADVVTTREFVGESAERQPTEVSIEMLNAGIQRWGSSTPFPALPFPSVYIGFGSGVGLHERNAHAYLGGGHADRKVIGFVLCGFMLSEFESFAHFRMLLVDGRQTHGLVQMHDGDQWLAPMSLAPWIAPVIVGALATDAGPRTLPTFAMKRDAKKLSREVGQTIKPPAFYRVTVRRSPPTTPTTPTTEREQGERAPLSFRFDVSAHDRVLVRRGDAATIDPRERVRLTRLGWRWYDDGDDVPDEARALLATRGRAAPSSGEWLAIKIVRVRSHERGPEGARVPSLRVIAGEGESK